MSRTAATNGYKVNVDEEVEVKVNKKFEKFLKWVKDFSIKHLKKICEEETELDYDDYFEQKMESVFRGKLYEVCGKGGKKENKGPKKPLTPWICFCNDMRGKLKKENSTLAPKDITKKLGEMWKEMTDKKKEKYVKMSAEDRKRYEMEIEELPEEQRPTKKQKPASKVNGYIIFSREKREKLKGKYPFNELSKKIADDWKELNDKQKDKYKEKANEENKKLLAEQGFDDSLTEKNLKIKSKAELEKIAKENKVKINPKKDKKDDIIRKILKNAKEPVEEEEEELTKKKLEKKNKDELIEIATQKDVELEGNEKKAVLIEKILGTLQLDDDTQVTEEEEKEEEEEEQPEEEEEEDEEEEEQPEEEEEEEQPEEEEAEGYTEEQLSGMKLPEIKQIASNLGLPINKKKGELINDILESQSADE